MSITVLEPGLQTTIQAGARNGMRYLGVPASGAADPLSLALANRLLGNDLLAPALEATLVGPALGFDASFALALTGGLAKATLNGEPIKFHQTVLVNAGDELAIGSVETGTRVYLAFAGGLQAADVLGSVSTYMPARLGGHEGRALVKGDVLQTQGESRVTDSLQTPVGFRPPITSRWAVRACRSAETHLLQEKQRDALVDTRWTIGRRADRMGMQLDGPYLEISSDGRMPSAPVFPGTIQCPEDGLPFILSVDAGTTGGYPRIAQVARMDRHLLGQMRPGDHVRFLPREPQEAIAELRVKHDYWREWLPSIERVI
jgi:biotin-dependent carboxylase-like uncharacterized protein